MRAACRRETDILVRRDVTGLPGRCHPRRWELLTVRILLSLFGDGHRFVVGLLPSRARHWDPFRSKFTPALFQMGFGKAYLLSSQPISATSPG